MGENGVLLVCESGVLLVGETGVLLVGENGVQWVRTEVRILTIRELWRWGMIQYDTPIIHHSNNLTNTLTP